MTTTKTSNVLLSKGESALVIAIKGNTEVSVTTTDKALIQPQVAVSHREPHIVLSECEYGRLLLSPKGQRMSLHLSLPVELASEQEFVLYARMLYREYLEAAS